MIKISIAVIGLVLSATQPAMADALKPAPNLTRYDYDGYSLWIDCEQRSAVKFQYIAQRDNGYLKRHNSFYVDPGVPARCQQTSRNTYKKGYDRGHLVPANHLDHSKLAIRQSNYMTNILPQTKTLNRGAWLKSEEIVECYRDKMELWVAGGHYSTGNNSASHTLKTHGVKIPEYFWKIVIKGDGNAIAWIMPNDFTAKKDRLNQYQVPIYTLEQKTGERFPVSDNVRSSNSIQPWPEVKHCNKG